MVLHIQAISPLFEDVKAGHRLDRGTRWIVEWRCIVVRVARGYPEGFCRFLTDFGIF